MHEHHAVKKLVDEAVAKASQHAAKKVSKVTFGLGELVGFDDGSIRLYYDEMVKGTALEGAELAINHHKPKLQCKDCSAIFEDHKRAFQCPQCCSAALVINRGKEFYLESIDVE